MLQIVSDFTWSLPQILYRLYVNHSVNLAGLHRDWQTSTTPRLLRTSPTPDKTCQRFLNTARTPPKFRISIPSQARATIRYADGRPHLKHRVQAGMSRRSINPPLHLGLDSCGIVTLSSTVWEEFGKSSENVPGLDFINIIA